MAGATKMKFGIACSYKLSEYHKELMTASLRNVGLDDKEVEWFSPTAMTRIELKDFINTNQIQLILSVGKNSTDDLCDNNDIVLDNYVGSVLYIKDLQTMIFPTSHPNIIQVKGSEAFKPIYDAIKIAEKIFHNEYVFPEIGQIVGIEHEEAVNNFLIQMNTNLAANETVALDLETSGLDISTAQILCLAISFRNSAYVLDQEAMSERNVKLLVGMFNKYTWVLHNPSFDFQFLYRDYDAIPETFIDSMSIAIASGELGKDASLKKLASKYLGAPDYDEEIKQYMSKETGLLDCPKPTLFKYAGYDAYYTYYLPSALGHFIDDHDMNAASLMNLSQKVYAKQSLRGIKLNLAYLHDVNLEWAPKIEQSKNEFIKYASQKGFDARDVVAAATHPDINPNSPKQLQHFFFDILKLPPLRGKRTTNQEFLKLHKAEYGVQLLNDYRSAEKIMNVYIKGMLKSADINGVVHPNFLAYGTVTGRISMQNPPMQTIPREERMKEIGFPSIKKIFVPHDPEMVWVEADYNQLELRVAWHLSGDEALGRAIMSTDFHRATAANIFNTSYDDVTSEQRRMSKYVTFGVMYGRQANALAQGELRDLTGGDSRQAQHYIDAFWASYPDFYEWMQQILFTVIDETELLVYETGRRRRWTLVTDNDQYAIGNQAMNFPVQSLASDINLNAMIKLDHDLQLFGYGYPLFPST